MATCAFYFLLALCGISIHTTLAGGDVALCQGLLSTHRFQSTPPSRVATASTGVRNGRGDDFNPHHPRGWRLQRSAQKKGRKEFQSTPPSRVATLMYCDMEGFAIEISIHTTLAGGDGKLDREKIGNHQFQSTPPSRVATEETRLSQLKENISIHTTLAGGDRHRRKTILAKKDFNPHHPRGWRHATIDAHKLAMNISIHTTLAGGDGKKSHQQNFSLTISIHTTLAGGDLKKYHQKAPDRQFQSTPPSRVATLVKDGDRVVFIISIHTTLAGGDGNRPKRPKGRRGFQSTPPSRVATCFIPLQFIKQFLFQSTPPSRVATSGKPTSREPTSGFQSTPPSRVATIAVAPWKTILLYFNPHHPRGWRPRSLFM